MDEHVERSELDRLIAWHTAMANEPKRNEAKRQKYRATAALLAASKPEPSRHLEDVHGVVASDPEPQAQTGEPDDADFAYWYWRACETLRPRDWMHAALHAQRILKTKQPDAAISQAQEALK